MQQARKGMAKWKGKPKVEPAPTPADEAKVGYCPKCMQRRYIARGTCLTCGAKA